jgi:hypothetical protein
MENNKPTNIIYAMNRRMHPTDRQMDSRGRKMKKNSFGTNNIRIDRICNFFSVPGAMPPINRNECSIVDGE